MALTLSQKLTALHAAEDATAAAMADLVDASTGEAIAPDRPVVDVASGRLYSNVNGKFARSKVTLFPAKAQ